MHINKICSLGLSIYFLYGVWKSKVEETAENQQSKEMDDLEKNIMNYVFNYTDIKNLKKDKTLLRDWSKFFNLRSLTLVIFKCLALPVEKIDTISFVLVSPSTVMELKDDSATRFIISDHKT